MVQTVTRNEAVQKILVIREAMEVRNRQIKEAEGKKKDMWNKIKDFDKADAITADKGYDYMASLTRQIMKLTKANAADNRKIKKIENADKDEQV